MEGIQSPRRSRRAARPSTERWGLAGLSLVTLGLLAGLSQPLRASEEPDAASKPVAFGPDIRPILSDRCFQCHGPDEASRQAGLRLDRFEFASEERDGIQAIVPGDPAASELWRRISSEDPDELMPPAHGQKQALSGREQKLFWDWIEAGATYDSHWSFAPPERPAPPDCQAPAKGAIDRFLFAEQERQGLAPSAPAPPARLLRRLMLDLTGLPPTPEETEHFLAELEGQELDAVWSRWVRRLFSEEPYRSRYAERMASPWLDQARYGDTNGIHTDAGRQIWPWRDWVLNAYRSNMPFDRFLTEQLAGDLLEQASVEQRIASGFNRNHVITDEGGAIDEEYLVEYAVDRASTTASVFLGLTMGCARCHDHKFDPISQEEFFRFFAFFNSNDEPGLYSQLPDPKRAFEPSIERPSSEQSERRVSLAQELATAREELLEPSAADLAELEAFRDGLGADLGLTWVDSSLESASSAGGAEMRITEQGSLLVSGANPATDVHTLRLSTQAEGLRVLQLDALKHASFVGGAPGRGVGGNGMLTGIEVQAVSRLNPEERRTLDLTWAWADYAQDNDDYGILRAFDARHNTGWAIGGHIEAKDCSALFVSREPFGYPGGTELVLKLSYESIWSGLVFGHVALSLAQLSDQGLERLPLAQGAWYHVGPFELESASGAYQAVLGPEDTQAFDPGIRFPWGEGGEQSWSYAKDYRDGVPIELSAGTNVHFVGREVYAPTARSLELSLGSDDGFALWLNGELIQKREVPRGVQPDQDRVEVALEAGRNVLVLQVINTGGQAGFYYQALEEAAGLPSELVSALVRRSPLSEPADRHAARIAHAWRLSKSPEYGAGLERIAGLEEQAQALEREIPRSMVMSERAEARESFVLVRGEYDKPDPERPVLPGVPAALGSLPELEGRATRLDLARWMTSGDNPLVARVAVNRLWQLVFGRGLVPSSADFGYQGSWPTHPELLDWLSVEFVESGWDTQHILGLIVESHAYRQSSRVRPEVLRLDPEHALLAGYPRRRLDAEMIRDQALHVSGLLQEEFGGPSVKPYQPTGLWREVAMPASNTRNFEVGVGSEMWRRSVYTYWKRACPPPSMLTFDAPTREACSIQRASTNTPLQALVLWNDEQFVEAARLLAQRTLQGAGSEEQRLGLMFQRCTGRQPSAVELELLGASLAEFRERYRGDPAAAALLLESGIAPVDDELEPAELAAWSMIGSAMLNLHATITQG